jgi:biotin carboxyl carrier protein
VPVTAAAEGEIKEILAAGAEVAENDIVAKLAGYEAAQRKIEEATSDVERYQKRIAASEAKKQKAEASSPGSGERYQKEIDGEQQKIAEREKKIEAARQEMEPYIVRAPIAGKIATERAAGQKVAAGDAVFSIELPPRLQARFTIETGDVPGKHDKVKVAAKSDESKAGTCTVSEISETNQREITVICPSAEPFADGAEVVLLP